MGGRDVDDGSSSNPIQDMFGMQQEKTNTCCKCKIAVTSSDTVRRSDRVNPQNERVGSSYLFSFFFYC